MMKRTFKCVTVAFAIASLGMIGYAAESVAEPAPSISQERSCASSPRQPSWCMDWISDNCDGDLDCN